MMRQGDGRMAIGRKKGLSITEDSTLRQQTEFGQRMRGKKILLSSGAGKASSFL